MSLLKLQCENCGADLQKTFMGFRCLGCEVEYLGNMDWEPILQDFCRDMETYIGNGTPVAIYRQTQPSYNVDMIVDGKIRLSFGHNFNSKKLAVPNALFFVRAYKNALKEMQL